jgi:hypothetical protein
MFAIESNVPVHLNMVANLNSLSETVDLTRIDRKLADLIESDLERINAEIADHGYGDVTVEGKTYRITKRVGDAAATAA